jgi:hypothetical protein
LFVLLANLLPLGPDYLYVFRPIAESFLRGETRLYDENSTGYYNLPWLIFVFLPMTFLPLHYGQALLSILSLLGLVMAIAAISVQNRLNFLIFTLAIANLHTLDLLIRGNVDGLLALGLGLTWFGILRKNPFLLGCGLWILSVKPINILFTVPVFVRLTWHWSLREKLLSISPLAVTFVLSFLIFGFDWPVRYIQVANETPPLTFLQTSLWRAFEFYGLQRQYALFLFPIVLIVFSLVVIKLKNMDAMVLSLVLSANMVFSPYTLGSHYVILSPVFVVLAQKSNWFIALWVLTLTPILRLVAGSEVAWLDIFYPVAMMLGTTYFVFRSQKYFSDL